MPGHHVAPTKGFTFTRERRRRSTVSLRALAPWRRRFAAVFVDDGRDRLCGIMLRFPMAMLVAVTTLASCRGERATRDVPAAPAEQGAMTVASTAGPDDASVVPDPGARTGTLMPSITDPALLAELEASGLHLAELLGGGAARTNRELHAASARYRDFVAFAREDISDSVAQENQHRPDWGAVGTTMRAKRRSFDPAWLVASNATYELVGVLNRMDRAPFVPGSCGDLRLTYRLAYQAPKIASRMPLTVNLVYRLAPGPGGCRDLVAQWRLPPAPTAAWLRSEGPLRAKNLGELLVIQANYQVIRTAAAIRNQHGGTAEYVLRAFHERDGRLVRAPLENTPDVARLTSDAALRAELRAFLAENLDAIDRGTFLIPERFLATRASSFSPHGLARRDNRLFDAVFDPSDFADLDYTGRQLVRTPEAVLLRLDDLSCVGCHQGRTIAGFHLVGEDRAGTHPLNAVFFAGSGHFRSEQARRLAYLEELERGGTPSTARPFSFAPTSARAGYGDTCAMPGARIASWTCEPGLTCQRLDPAVGQTELGHCFPEERRGGDPCLQHDVIQDHHSLDKMVMPWTELGCASGYTCRQPGGGFPNGMCTSPCDAIGGPGEICGPTAGSGFADCLAGTTTFRTCLERHGEHLSRGRCNATRSCRNDYICAHMGSTTDGACVPAYFLFQLRLDGHVPPT